MRRAPATAKLNLALVVGPARDDGRHEVVTILQRLDLADRIAVEPAAKLRVEGFAEDTLVRRALESVAAAAQVEPRWRATISKRIPVAAGLGGGSSDAAAALSLANETLDEPLAPERLQELAACLGADVPFFLTAGPQLARGTGTELEQLDHSRRRRRPPRPPASRRPGGAVDPDASACIDREPGAGGERRGAHADGPHQRLCRERVPVRQVYDPVLDPLEPRAGADIDVASAQTLAASRPGWAPAPAGTAGRPPPSPTADPNGRGPGSSACDPGEIFKLAERLDPGEPRSNEDEGERRPLRPLRRRAPPPGRAVTGRGSAADRLGQIVETYAMLGQPGDRECARPRPRAEDLDVVVELAWVAAGQPDGPPSRGQIDRPHLSDDQFRPTQDPSQRHDDGPRVDQSARHLGRNGW